MTSSTPTSFRQTARVNKGLGATLALVAAVSLALPSTLAQAGITDIAAQPLATTSPVQAKPNLLFILDNSGSMSSDYMPDDMYSTGTYGFKSAQCNGVAYDPTITYSPPVTSTGSSYPNASFTAAKDDGFKSSSTTYNLTGAVYYTYKGSQPKMGWRYTTSGVTANTFYNECTSTVGYSPGSSVFTAVTLSSTSAEAQNYANWFSYYRKRYLMVRSALGQALLKLDSSYRVGFSIISDTSATDGTNYFRDVKDFDATQKSNVFSSLYTVTPSSWTPLRAALSKAGRYYANKAPGQTYDPVQYSCQRNYALLSTDGYWNANQETSTYGPFVVDSNTNVGEQDATEARPMKDASVATTTTVTTYTAPGTADYKSSNQSSTLPWSRVATVTVTGKTSNGCRGSYYQAKYTQTATETRYRYFTTPQQGTLSYTSTMTSIDGGTPTGPVVTSPTMTGTWTTVPGSSTSTVIFGDTGTPASSAYGGDTYITGSGKCVASAAATTYTTPTSGSWSSWSGSLTYSYTNITATGPYTAGTPVTSTTYSGGSSDSLADVAEYYWKNDLRTSALGNCTSSTSGISRDVCTNIVRTTPDDPNTAQHMNTFTMGFGTNGTLLYDKNYPTQTSGDFVDVKNGVKNWTNPYDGAGAENIDDLWHAAVNGRGRYYSITNSTDLSDAIAGVVASIDAKTGAAAAAATSTLELVSGDNNQIFSASYTTYQWTGDLKAYTIDGSANISSTPDWSAQTILDGITYSSRKIYFNGSGTLTLFNYSNLSGTQQGYFNNLCSQSVVSGQCSTLSTTDKTLANTGLYLVNYLRGDRTYESTTTTTSGTTTTTVAALYRARQHVLGDIINGAPVYVGKPPFSYADSGYADFVSANRTRKPVVYVAANDGMLHAISADTSDGGTELWAFIPSAVMPNMYKLADINYGIKHQYFVDGAPVIGDVYIGGAWKTILVGGLNKGGNSYYALDITNPTAPVMLWEFTDPNMGLTYGNPVITKNKTGKWVVAVASGLNNTTGDGKGHFFVIDAATGTKLVDINTGAGTTTTPSGLSKINAWVDSTTDNTAKHFYGGDMLGNVWRLDPDARYAASANAVQLAKLQLDSVTPQPITTKPVTALISSSNVVIVGTGRYLGESDISDTTTQSIYAIRDPLGTTGWGDVRADTTDFTKQTITLNSTTASAATSASITTNTVDWTKGGWWVDLPQAGERVAINMGLQLGTLAVGTAIPNGDACSSGGSSWRYYFNITTGSAIPGYDIGARWSTNTLIVGISWVKDADGNVRTIFQDSDGKLRTEVPPTTAGGGGGSTHRTSWRELID